MDKNGAILGFFEVFWDVSPPPLSPSTEEGEWMDQDHLVSGS